MQNITTKKGDNGWTMSIEGKKVKKNSAIIKLFGGLDELNAHLSFAEQLLKKSSLKKKIKSTIKDTLEFLQKQILNGKYGSALIGEIDSEIEKYGKGLKPLEGFIKNGDSKMSGYLHVCRTVARRVEILSVEANYNKNINVFLNRLSDLLFLMAQHC